MIARRQLLAASAMSALLTRCGPAPPPAVVEVTIKGGADQNPDPAGTPVAVAVRLYSLNAPGKFAAADAYALMDREKATLGEDGAGSEEVVVRPGETKTVTLSPKAGVRFLGVAVLFRDIDHAAWRARAPIAPSGLTKLVLSIAGTTAKLGKA